MRKKTAKNIQLVLITSVLASCAQPEEQHKASNQRIFMRSEATAPYTEVTENYNQGNSGGGMGMGNSLLWFMAFRHLSGGFGYANNSLHPQSVAGTNAGKASAFQTQRGGFGRNANAAPQSSYGS